MPRKLTVLLSVVATVAVVIGVAVVAFAFRPGGPLATQRLAAQLRSAPLSPERYQQALTATDAALADALKTVTAAAPGEPLLVGLGTAAAAMKRQANAFADVRPPLPMRATHDLISNSLMSLSYDLSTLGSTGSGSWVCAGSGVPGAVSDLSPAARLRAAVRELATADPARRYTFGAFLPPEGNRPRQLGTGTFLKAPAPAGQGYLELDNQGTTDAVIGLAPAGSTTALLNAYVAQGTKPRIGGIPRGNYDVYLSTGIDWDAGTGRFARNCTFEKLAKPLDYRGNAGEQWSFTLSPSSEPASSEQSATIPADSFPR